jgi:hypothetical protein
MATFLSYWKPETVRRMFKESDQLLNHSAGAQLNRLKPGDTLFITTVNRGGDFRLVGRINVESIVDQKTAQSLLNNDNLWIAKWHVIAKRGTEVLMQHESLKDIASSLRFEGGVDRLKVNRGRVNPQQLQTLRQLTPASAADLNDRFEQVNQSDAQVTLNRAGVQYGDSETNQKVERAAVRFVLRRYQKEGWRIQSVEADKCGYDLHCTKNGRIKKIEVKGTRGTDVSFILTNREYQCATNDEDWALCVVTGALSKKPRLHQYAGDEIKTTFLLQPLAFRGTLL